MIVTLEKKLARGYFTSDVQKYSFIHYIQSKCSFVNVRRHQTKHWKTKSRLVNYVKWCRMFKIHSLYVTKNTTFDTIYDLWHLSTRKTFKNNYAVELVHQTRPSQRNKSVPTRLNYINTIYYNGYTGHGMEDKHACNNDSKHTENKWKTCLKLSHNKVAMFRECNQLKFADKIYRVKL